ncbi:hypothetical protein [Desulfovibrio intestinalis]|uniref:Uncharacterized protein n=1 Tax=Desulfovibrio intestinalis TaxID=58621 RepID=A0A7W8FED2_9BACT|nr:hypothetical protein [Desulfovibrio intestinalis]MBB5143644.1 hypothetical protein [Desulfovibrio intestinalis]
MDNNAQTDYLKALEKKGNEWICAYEIIERLEISLEELLNAYGDGLIVYDADLKNKLYPVSQLDDKILYSNDAALFGQIDFDCQKEMLVLLKHDLPSCLKFELNEMTGEWRLTVDYDGFTSDPFSRRESGEYEYTISMKKLYNFSKYSRDESEFTIIIHAAFLKDACLTMQTAGSVKLDDITVLLQALYNNIMFYGVPLYYLNKAKRILDFKDYNSARTLAYASEFAYYYFYDVPKTKDGIEVFSDLFSIDEYARKYNISYQTARRDILRGQQGLFIKIADFRDFIEKKKEKSIEEKTDEWDKFTLPQQGDTSQEDFGKYKLFVGLKFKGCSLKEIFDEVLSKSSKATTEAAKDTACSKLGNKVKKFARENNLPLWIENRGRPIAGNDKYRISE